MAILKDLIVHGSSRFLNKIYASEIQTPLIEAEAGIFKKLKADDATVVGLLDVKGQLHTNSWSNSNIATIDGSFYITPTIGSASGTVAITANSLNFSGTNYAVTSLYLGDNSSITWPQYSKVLVTGQILSNGEWIPLGTLLGQLSATAAAASIKINNIKDNKNQTSSVLATLVNNGTTSSDYRNLKVSLYQRASSSTAFYPLGIYITATGDNGRTFLDIYGGVESLENNTNHGGFAEPNVRIGNLQGLPNVGGQTPSGWGVYTDNGYFKGIIAADRGYIGTGSKYWVIANYEDGSNPNNSRSYIYNNTDSVTSIVEGIYLGTDGIRNYKDSTHYVTIKDGVITALGVNLTGQINATAGNIGGASITGGTLIVGNANINDINASKINAGDIAAARIQTNLISAINAKVSDLSALTATIGGFQIDSSSIHTKNVAVISNVDNSIALSSADFTRTINSISRTGLRLAIGDKFGVTGDGTVYASDVDLTGKITATSGEIGGITIDNNGKLWITNANISGTINTNHIDVSSINIGDLNGASNYALKTEITDAEKVATSYITYIDSTEGIKIHNISDQVNYLKLNSSAISMYRNNIETLNISNNEIRVGKFSDNNVYIDSDSVDIRNGTTTLASFTGDNTKFYDPIYNKELATFGTSGAIIGTNNEQRFVIEKDGIKSINDSGATVFSVNSTEGTVVTEAEVAPSGETDVWSSTSITLDTVGSGFSVDVTFYNKSMTAIFEISNCNSNLTNVKVNSVSSSAILISTGGIFGLNAGTYSIALPPFTFTHGTAQTTTYTITASFVNTFGDSYNLTAVETVTYDGAITITLSSFDGECVRTSGNNEEESMFLGLWSKVIYGEIYQSSAYTKAPAMTFGTRGKNAILAPFSVTIGEDLYANNDNQLSIGRYNLNNDEFFPLAFVIGNGVNDTDRSNAFNVDWDGNVENMGDLKVGGNETVTGDLTANRLIGGALHCNGVSKFTGKMTYNGVGGLFFVKSYIYNASIAANGTWYHTDQTTITITNYKAIAIAGFGVWNDGGYCDVIKCYIWNEDNKDILDIGVKNRKNAAVTVKIHVKIFYIARNVCPQ